MSYNLSVSDDSSFEMVSTDTVDYDFLFDFPFSPLYNSSSDYNLQALLDNNQNQQNPVDHQSTSSDRSVSVLLPSSPPTDQLENLSLHQTSQFSSLSFGPSSENGYEIFNNNSNNLEIKIEECELDFDENVAKYLQRSFSSNSFEGKPNFSFQPQFDPLMEANNLQVQAFSMPENSFLTGQMRKVCSTGDLENMRNVHSTQRSILTHSAVENSFMEDTPFKVGRYNPEERQERISKYRAKRNQRNFNKTIKYACRKTLADNRPRIRGRFARNDETVEIPKVACSTRDEDEDDLWALHEMEDETMAAGNFINGVSSHHQFQYHNGYF